MLSAHTVGAIRAAEQALSATLRPGELMQRAARGLSDVVHTLVSAEARIIALVGAGNNGGDTLFAAALLRRRGHHVDVCIADRERVHEPGRAAALAAGAEAVDSPIGYDVALDGVVGIGGAPGLRGRAIEWADWIERAQPYVIAVDVPSGLVADTCRVEDRFLPADVIVTFGTYKISTLVDPAASSTPGATSLIDIGLDEFLSAPSLDAYDRPAARAALGRLAPRSHDHKYTRGVVGIAAGSAAYAGAAHLCIAGAQAGPAGMVRFVGSDELSRRVVDRAPELVAGHGRVQAWTVGSGSGDDAREQIQMALDDRVTVIIDADALVHLPATLDSPTLLTPHAGELAAMLGASRDDVEADPLTHVEHAAERWQTSVLLKGRRTLVATPGQPTRVNLTGSPWLATAGSGDVLAGLAGSLAAAGADPHTAGSLAAYVHGLAADAANPGGPITASALAAAIPAVIAAVLRDDDPSPG